MPTDVNKYDGKPWRKFFDVKNTYKIPTTIADWDLMTKGTSVAAKAFQKAAEERFEYALAGAKARIGLMKSSMNDPWWTEHGTEHMQAFFGSTSSTMQKLLRRNLEAIEAYLFSTKAILDFVQPEAFNKLVWAWCPEISGSPKPYMTGPNNFRLNYRFFAQPDVDGFVIDGKELLQLWTPGLYVTDTKADFEQPFKFTPTDAQSAGDTWEIDKGKTLLTQPEMQSTKHFILASILIHEAAHLVLGSEDISYKIEVDGKDYGPIGYVPLVAARFVHDISLLAVEVTRVAENGKDEEIPESFASLDMMKGRTQGTRWLRVADLPVSRPLLLQYWADYLPGVAKQGAKKQAAKP